MTGNERQIDFYTTQIDGWINVVYEEYNRCGRSEWYIKTYNYVCGMVAFLELLTGKEYWFDETGLHEGVKTHDLPL